MSYPSPDVSRLVEANMTRWLEREKLDKKVADQATPPKLGPFLVMSRQCGAGGEEIARLLANKPGWELADREVLERIANDFNVSNLLVDFVDEKHVAWLTQLSEAWLEGQVFSQTGFIRELGELLMIAAQNGNFIMVGRSAQFILPREFGRFLRLHAPLELRVANVQASRQLFERVARELVSKTDEERTKFLKAYFRNDGTSSELYDLVIDTSHVEPQSVAEIGDILVARIHTRCPTHFIQIMINLFTPNPQ